jgi:5-methylcytosine-specific restriction protein B
MYLLEYRDRAIPLAAGGAPFAIPANVRILGTMNTADRSIALVDHALRRRFAFIPLPPNTAALRAYHQGRAAGFPTQRLVDILDELNRQIGNAHYAVGVSFFMHEKLGEHIADIWRMEIEPYLEEYFFDRPDKVKSFRWAQIEPRLWGPNGSGSENSDGSGDGSGGDGSE